VFKNTCILGHFGKENQMILGRGFIAGLVVGFGAGVAFKTLADDDFKPIKEVLQNGASAVNKVTSGVAEAWGRFHEAWEDAKVEQQAKRAQRVETAPIQATVTKAAKKTTKATVTKNKASTPVVKKATKKTSSTRRKRARTHEAMA
jgi:Sec-independent protein translocase protein TatA